MNTFGRIFRLTSFGESHGPAVGAVIDGCPAGVKFDQSLLLQHLERRRPGGALATQRTEADKPEILSGVFDGVTTGAPLAVLVHNTDQRSADYQDLKNLYRPSHADFTYDTKYGLRDYRGGGRSSARETVARVIAGAVAAMMLRQSTGIRLSATVRSIGEVVSQIPIDRMEPERIYASPVRCDDPAAEVLMTNLIEAVRAEGDSAGGVVEVLVLGVPPGLGDPVYGKLNATLAAAMMSINGAMGFEMGAGFSAAGSKGSLNNDQFTGREAGPYLTTSNNSGGVQGGISNGMPLQFRVAFKPPSSIARQQEHGTAGSGAVQHTITGRHDPTIVVRAVPVVEAMAWLVLADVWLANRLARLTIVEL